MHFGLAFQVERRLANPPQRHIAHRHDGNIQPVGDRFGAGRFRDRWREAGALRVAPGERAEDESFDGLAPFASPKDCSPANWPTKKTW
jgi:hypothetical protein